MSKHLVGLRLFYLTGCLILICAAAPFLNAQNTINVPANQTTIQAAINAANNGDTVLVAPGTYHENINFMGKTITVTSSGGPAATTINGGGAGSVVTIDTAEGRNSVLSGFTITNGSATIGPHYNGGGIYVFQASPTISGNVITGNVACAGGGGIDVEFSSALIQGNTITNNSQAGCSGGGGGGIEVGGAGSVQIIGNTISRNSWNTGDGAAILLNAAGTPTIQNNTISGNRAWGLGGGIELINDSDALIVQNLIFSNNSAQGGAIAFSVPSGSRGPFLVNNTIANNTANGDSGIYASGFDAQSELFNNILFSGSGQPVLYCDTTYSQTPPVIQANDAITLGSNGFGGGCTGSAGTNGNIVADPLFFDPASDFHIQFGSPAVDVGNNSAPSIPATDFDGNPRVVDGNGHGIAVVDMGAYEVSPTTITLAPNSLIFGPQPLGSTSAPQTVTLTNTGNAKLLLAISANSEFGETNNCGSSMAAGANCSINVTFSPTVAGNITGTLTLKDTASGSPQTVALAGTGGAPTASLTPTSLNFGTQLVGTTSPAQTITLSNTGNDVMGISSIASSGDFAETNNCGTTLAAGASCSISVTFTPTAIGARSGSVTVTDNASGSPQSVSLTGTGTAPIATVSPTSLGFGSQVIGTTSSAQSATLSNTGTARLTISGITITGDFAQTNNCGTTLAAGASCSINVTFTPTVTGTRTGSLTISSNSQSGAVAVALSGAGVESAPTFNPTSLAFSSQIVGTKSGGMDVHLTANGPGPLAISSITVTGAFLESTNCPASLNKGSNCNITINFLPTAGGPATGAIVVTDNGLGSPQTIPLSGNGLDFTLTASPASNTVNAGNTAQYTVTATAVGGSFDHSVNLSCSGLPAASTCQFSPGGISPKTGSASSSLAIQTTARQGSSGTPSGTYTITIIGKSDPLTHSTTVNLTVN